MVTSSIGHVKAFWPPREEEFVPTPSLDEYFFETPRYGNHIVFLGFRFGDSVYRERLYTRTR